ncbi:LacI family DNA-binding transcriptional regulator [Zavarzinia sp.]|uniref:LacI family DNA-binding transcriptional regulator n=1 Tax=Zavarzinia sp. TaxID=2027920 RepID=UPI003BB68C5E
MVLVPEDNIDVLSHRLFDGILVIAWKPETFEVLEKLDGTPVVVVNRGDKDNQFHTVISDHRAGGRMVGDYLLDRGHRKLAMITKSPDWGALARAEGMRTAMETRGIPVDDQLFAFCDDGRLMYAHLKKIVDCGAEAVWVCGEDMLAPEALYILQEVLGIKVPAELSVVGSENPGISLYLRPSLTTLFQPLQGVAEAMVDLLAKLIECPEAQVDRVISMPNTLIERDSVAIRKVI